jgi:2-dehydro-3-deoxyphosphogluconate aldolase/(4S)-4-hydroxy-2-oxoglutarate aldolase
VDSVSVFEAIASCGLVPVAVIDDSANAVPLGGALLAAGLPCVEVTFRTSAAADSIEALTRELPDLLVGAGTVLTVAQAEAAVVAGSRFIVSPVTDPGVVGWCLDRGIPVVPGASTPTEVHAAMAVGADVIKFFPAEPAGGIGAITSMAAVFPDVRFVPTGGIGPGNLSDYLAVPAVVACGGTWIASRAAIRDRDWAGVERRAADAVALARNVISPT